MNSRNTRKLLQNQWGKGNFCCIELNPVWDNMPDCVKNRRCFLRPVIEGVSVTGIAATQIRFCAGIIAETKRISLGYKLKARTFEVSGNEGRYALNEIIRMIHFSAPEVLVVYDARHDDTGVVSVEDMHDAFDVLGVDMIVINPNIDAKMIQLLSGQKGKGFIIECHPHNGGAGKTPTPQVAISAEEANVLHALHATCSHAVGDATKDCSTSLSNHVAYQVAHDWSVGGDSVVAIDTKFPHELRQIRGIIGDVPVLTFGMCAQDSDLKQTIDAAKDTRGQGVIVNLPSSLVFSSPEDDYAKVAGKIATDLSAKIRKCCGAES